jgi:hypothetical protein
MINDSLLPFVRYQLNQQSNFRNIIQEIGALQGNWSSNDTEEMHGRGLYIRNDGPGIIRQWLSDSGVQPNPTLGPHGVRGNDGVGRKAQIPWIRAYFSKHSPKTTQGWYVVYLFEATGKYVYLSINQGTTDLVHGSFVNKSTAELSNRVEWARNVLSEFQSVHDQFTTEISLNGNVSGLSKQYERGQALGIRYEISDLPSEDTIRTDFLNAWEGLKSIHHLEIEYGDTTVPSHSEIAEAEEAVRYAAGKGGKGQGFGLTKPEKDAVEWRAMDRTRQHFEDDGWYVEDVHSNHSFDFRCKKANEIIDVEVKGTTSQGAAIVLTFNEVVHMRDRFPNSALAIVSSIKLQKNGKQPTASGGKLRVIRPWEIDDTDLRPIGYKYSVPPQ